MKMSLQRQTIENVMLKNNLTNRISFAGNRMATDRNKSNKKTFYCRLQGH